MQTPTKMPDISPSLVFLGLLLTIHLTTEYSPTSEAKLGIYTPLPVSITSTLPLSIARDQHQPPTTTLPKLSYQTMPSSIDNVIEMMMAINSFGPQFDPQSIPSYRHWLVNHTFDLFGPEPFSPTSNTNPGISLHARHQRESRLEESVCCIDCGHGSSGDMARIFPQEVSYPSTVDHESNTD